MNFGLYNDWANKRVTAQSYRMDKIIKRRKKRTNLMIKILIPGSVSFITIGAFTLAQFFPLVFMILSFIIAVGMSVLIYLDDKDNKKVMETMESWSDVTSVHFVPPSIKDTFN